MRKYIARANQLMIRRKKAPAETALQAKGVFIDGDPKNTYYMAHEGFCPCCEKQVTFMSRNSWLRDHYLCTRCKCVPRERAFMTVLETHFPNWQKMSIHESSPAERGASVLLKEKAKRYIASQYFPNEKFGATVQGFRNEDLEAQTFKDSKFDLVVTLDVMEHIYDPKKVFKEVSRTLKKGGAYVFTVPIINKHEKTQVWAKRSKDGSPIFLHEPEYHGNPVDENGSPVTYHWGYDIVDFIKKHTDMTAKIVAPYDPERGIMGEYNEVIVAFKP